MIWIPTLEAKFPYNHLNTRPWNIAFLLFMLFLIVFTLLISRPIFAFLLQKPALELSSDGFRTYGNKFFFKYTDIENLRTGRTAGSLATILFISLKNEDEYLQQIPSKIVRSLARIDGILTDTAFRANLTIIKGKNEDIVAAIKEAIAKNEVEK